MKSDPIDGETVPTQELAERIAGSLGCEGSHRVGDAWGPCPSREHLDYLIRYGSPAYREWLKKRRVGKKTMVIDSLVGPVPCLGSDVKSSGPKERFSSRAKAEEKAREYGCVGAHRVGIGFWSPCETPEAFNAHRGTKNRVTRLLREARRRPRKLNLRPMGRGVDTLPGGNMVSGKD